MKANVLIAGCGDVGSRLARQLVADGAQVYGLRRRPEQLPAGVIPVVADLAQTECPETWPAHRLDCVVFCAAPDQGNEAAYRNIYVNGLRNLLGWLNNHRQNIERLLLVSSTGVYGQHAGEWVDETSVCEPDGYSGRVLLEAEALALHSGFPTSVVRLAGLYGPGREWLLNQVRAGYQVPHSPPLYGNRIHSEDAANLLAFLLKQEAADVPLAPIYLGVDDFPAPLHEVINGLRDLLGVTHTNGETVIRRAGSKRCRNTRIKALGWRPNYPSWREGYADLITEKR